MQTHVDLITNALPAFKPTEPKALKDFSSLVFVTREFHGISPNSKSEERTEGGKPAALQVAVTVYTGSVLGAGTDGDVYIMIIGKLLDPVI